MSNAVAATLDSSSCENAWSRDDLSVQYSTGAGYPAALEPEIRLMAMILQDAVNCFQRFAGAATNPDLGEFRDAERWLFDGEEDWIFSFENICSCLGLDPHYIRCGLRQWQAANRNQGVSARARPHGSRRGRTRRSRASHNIYSVR